MDIEKQNTESGDAVLQARTYENISCSETESATNAFSRTPNFAGNELIRLKKRDHDYQLVESMFLTGMGELQRPVTIEAIHRNAHSSIGGKAQAQAFEIFSEAMEKKYKSPNINIKYAWYATSKEEISKILRYGFSKCESPENGVYGCGIYLISERFPILSMPSAIIDEDGSQHLLLCRAILGNQEVVHPGSKQFHPSSEEYDSGVDDRLTPKRYIVWSANINTHILPEYIITFRVLTFPSGVERTIEPEAVRGPRSPWLPISLVVSLLRRKVPPPSARIIDQYHKAFRDRKITRDNLVKELRQVVGHQLLIKTIQVCEAKRDVIEKMKERFPALARPTQM